MKRFKRTEWRTTAAAFAAIAMTGALAFGISTLPLSGSSADRTSYPESEKREIRKSLAFSDPAAPKEVSVDNIFGPIRVEGTDGRSVELEAVVTYKARTPEKLTLAKKEVRLEAASEGNEVDIYVDGPFRCQTEGNRGVNWRDRGYEVHYDFTVKVPRRTNLVLRTVTGGDVQVAGVVGRLDVHNVNGRIELIDVAGAVRAHTVNGRIRASFTRAPGEACSFKTINGDLELAFPQAPAADFTVRTRNGGVYSDFEVASLPGSFRTKSERRDGGFFYRSTGYSRFRVGPGGPEITLETMNGDILVAKTDRRK